MEVIFNQENLGCQPYGMSTPLDVNPPSQTYQSGLIPVLNYKIDL